MENLREAASRPLLACLLGKPSTGSWPCGSHGLSPVRLAPSAEVSDVPALAGALHACGSSACLWEQLPFGAWDPFTSVGQICIFEDPSGL